MKRTIDQQKKNNTLENRKTKPVQIVEMSDDNKPGSVKNLDIPEGATARDLKLQLGYKEDDDLLNGKKRQTLRNDTDLYSTIEANTKLVIIPNSKMGV